MAPTLVIPSLSAVAGARARETSLSSSLLPFLHAAALSAPPPPLAVLAPQVIHSSDVLQSINSKALGLGHPAEVAMKVRQWSKALGAGVRMKALQAAAQGSPSTRHGLAADLPRCGCPVRALFRHLPIPHLVPPCPLPLGLCSTPLPANPLLVTSPHSCLPTACAPLPACAAAVGGRAAGQCAHLPGIHVSALSRGQGVLCAYPLAIPARRAEDACLPGRLWLRAHLVASSCLQWIAGFVDDSCALHLVMRVR